MSLNNLSKEAMRFEEGHIPELTEGAAMQVFCKELATGNKIVEAVMTSNTLPLWFKTAPWDKFSHMTDEPAS